MVQIRTQRYIDVTEMAEEAQDAYRKLVGEMGIGNGEPFGWLVGEVGDCSVAESWIGPEACAIIDAEIRTAGLTDGDDIELVFAW